MIKLKTLILEADTATIAANLKKAYMAGPAAMRAYLDGPEGSSEEARALLQKQAADNDGDAADDKITIGKGSGAAMGFQPTQNQIDLMQSMSYPLGSTKTFLQAIDNPTAAGIVTSGKLIIDGHHRWSGMIGIGGDAAQVDSTDIQWPGKNTNQILAAAQLTIAAKLGGTQKTPSQSAEFNTNILGEPADKITKMIMANLGKRTDKNAPGPLLNRRMCYEILKDASILAKINKWSGGSVQPLKEISLKQKKAGEKAVDELRLSIAQKVAENLAALPKNDNAPARADMPQFDDKVGGPKPDTVKSPLEAGEFNVTPPFAKESIQNKKTILTKNTMKQKLKISIADQIATLKMKRTARIISESEYQKQIYLLEAGPNTLSTSEPMGLAILGAPAGGKSYTMNKIADLADDPRISSTTKSGQDLTVDKLRAEFQSKTAKDQLTGFVHAFYLFKEKAKQNPEQFAKWFEDISKMWTTTLAKSLPELKITVSNDKLMFDGKDSIDNLDMLDKLDAEATISKLDSYNDYKRVVRYFQSVKQADAIDKQLNMSYDEAGDDPGKIVANMDTLHKKQYVTDVFLIHPTNIATNLIQNFYRVVMGNDGGRDSSGAIITAFNDIEKSKNIYADNAEEVIDVTSKNLSSVSKTLKNATVVDDAENGDKPIDVFVTVAPMEPEEAFTTFIGKLDDEQKIVFKALLKYSVKALQGVPANAVSVINNLTSNLKDSEALDILKKAAAGELKNNYQHAHGGVTDKLVAKATTLFKESKNRILNDLETILQESIATWKKNRRK